MHFKQLLAQSLIWRGFYFAVLLLVNIFLSRSLQAEWIGWVYYASNIFSLLVLVLSFNLDAGITYFASSKKITANKLLWLGLLWSFFIAVASNIFFEFYPSLLPQHKELSAISILYFSLLYIFGMLLTNMGAALFYAQRNFKLPNIILIVVNLFLLAYLLFNQHTDKENLMQVLQVYFLSFLIQGILLIVAFVISNKDMHKIALPSSEELKRLYKYSTIVLMGNLIFFLVYRIDYWFVKYYCNAAQMGNYVQVNKMGQMLMIIPQIIASAVFPETSGGYDLAATRENVLVISRLFTALYIVLIIISALVCKWVFPFVFGATFNQMYLPFLIILPGIWALSVLALLAAYFSGKGMARINVYGGIVSVVVMIAGNFIFLPKGGGIIAASAISSVAYFLYMFYLLRKFNAEYHFNIFDFIVPTRNDFAWLISLVRKNKMAV